MQNSTNEFPVRDLAEKLKARIKAYGGPKAVWDQLDPRLKALENSSLKGLKSHNKRKITWDAFEKAFERLDKKQDTSENMSFGIKGNPILLMNIFKILGITGFVDITEERFVEPDPSKKIFSIESKIDILSEQLHELTDTVEIYGKKRSRMTAFKVAVDFENITNRLFSILKNHDVETSDALWKKIFQGQKKRFDIIFNDSIDKTELVLKYLRDKNLLKKQSEVDKFIAKIDEKYLLSYSGDNKQVLLFFITVMEYKDYCYYNSILRKYYSILNDQRNFPTDIREYCHTSPYILSPLYISLLYLTIVLRYAEKIRETPAKAEAKEIKKRLDQIKTGITPVQYFELMTSNAINKIKKILNVLDKPKKTLQASLYDIYLKILEQIVTIYHQSFENMGEISDEELDNYVEKIKGVYDFLSMRHFHIPGRYNLNTEIMDNLDILLNDLSMLARNTLRDING
jgi:hypothetical protein